MRKKLLVLFAVTGLVLAGCGGESEPKTAAPGQSPQEFAPGCFDLTASPTAEITMLDNTFDPDCFRVSGEQGLTLRNKGTAMHNFSVEGSHINLDVSSGEEEKTEAIGGALRPGSYKVSCRYHPPTMVAELEIV